MDEEDVELSKALNSRVCDLASGENLNDDAFIEMYRRVGDALSGAFGKVDSGMGGGWCDFWLRAGDVEYKLVLKPHKALKATQ